MPGTRSTRAAAALLVALALAGCGSDEPVATASRAPTALPAGATTPAQPTASPSPGTVMRTVFYVRDVERGLRLYAERHRRPRTAGVVRDAVTAMLTERPLDGDYTSLWPKDTELRGARLDGDLLVLDLSESATTASAGAAAEAISLQQLVWTATTAAPAAKRVQLLIEGERRKSLWGHADISRPIPRAGSTEVLGMVWLDVDEGATLRRGDSFGGEATVFEATVSWEWRAGGKAVKTGFSTATEGAPGRGTWTAEVDVPPGTYELRAFESSAEDGRPVHVETKAVTVT